MALFWKPMMNATAVPTSAIGSRLRAERAPTEQSDHEGSEVDGDATEPEAPGNDASGPEPPKSGGDDHNGGR